jgi:hypothetical protein
MGCGDLSEGKYIGIGVRVRVKNGQRFGNWWRSEDGEAPASARPRLF